MEKNCTMRIAKSPCVICIICFTVAILLSIGRAHVVSLWSDERALHAIETHSYPSGFYELGDWRVKGSLPNELPKEFSQRIDASIVILCPFTSLDNFHVYLFNPVAVPREGVEPLANDGFSFTESAWYGAWLLESEDWVLSGTPPCQLDSAFSIDSHDPDVRSDFPPPSPIEARYKGGMIQFRNCPPTDYSVHLFWHDTGRSYCYVFPGRASLLSGDDVATVTIVPHFFVVEGLVVFALALGVAFAMKVPLRVATYVFVGSLLVFVAVAAYGVFGDAHSLMWISLSIIIGCTALIALRRFGKRRLRGVQR